jgi:hypothetical protein
MQSVRKTLSRWIAKTTGADKQQGSATKPVRVLDERELRAVKGGSGSSTSSPTKTW